ncbi:Rha family transcriptional regulator [Clostridium sp.]|uniref:Rha family transcriptional regulator n=1 Tax=Clostridium sp. TaxID=1506 RepID=UPI003F2CD3F5
MNNELVRLKTDDVSKAIPITDTLVISEKFKVQHDSITRLIEKYSIDLEKYGKLKGFEILRDNKQRSISGYELNEMQFMLIVMYMKNTEIAREWKMRFVEAFFLMRSELLARRETRIIGKQIRRNLTDTIKCKVDGDTNFKKFAYSNYSKLVYKKVFGIKVDKIKEVKGLSKNDNIRDFLTIEELEKVQDLESKIATYIEMRKDLSNNDKEIYAEVKKYVDSICK